MDTTINTISQLGGTVFTVIAFLFYISKYQEKQIEAQIKLAIALESLTEKIMTNSGASNYNTIAIEKNTDAIK